jgi:hypothetical protein
MRGENRYDNLELFYIFSVIPHCCNCFWNSCKYLGKWHFIEKEEGISLRSAAKSKDLNKYLKFTNEDDSMVHTHTQRRVTRTIIFFIEFLIGKKNNCLILYANIRNFCYHAVMFTFSGTFQAFVIRSSMALSFIITASHWLFGSCCCVV